MPPILIIGKSGSGKDTVADYIEDISNYERIAFADPIKKFATALEFNYDEVYGTQAQKAALNKYWGISFRTFAQRFGTEICRNVLPTVIPDMNLNNRLIWARTAEIKFQKNYGRIIISDGRFLDEAQLVKEYGGTVIKITRDALDNSLSASETKHQSELELDQIEYDYLIKNNGTYDDLYQQVDDILNKLNNSNFDLDLNYDKYLTSDPNIQPIKKQNNYMALLTLLMTVLIPGMVVMHPSLKNLGYIMLAYVYSLKHPQILTIQCAIVLLMEFTALMYN